ncbi:MAG TPA: epoxyqueuosine reductase QueH [Bacillota bacterium]|jgi:predicted adenine nucleotide alpha hydrolase (AANH) superfamily ATPase|nr:epoxyqueuosine reductase QueH [Bacillota bacterium]HOL09193.1 epoxyqueuosine reductase QueH [Bacillota bacterium]HPO97017.1 epoxyqueuosine reductase QueH [Bacillota bacterium]
MQPILLHSCCGPCACYTVDNLRETGFEPTLFFYNPNIHPFQEYQRRLEGLQTLAEIKKSSVVHDNEYDLEEFLANVAANPTARCSFCYRMRLKKTALKAKELGVECFSTTLLISPYQNRDLLCQIGAELADEYGLVFIDQDFRPGFRQSQAMAKELNLYRQGYCGCIYSEKERYYKNNKK